MLYSEPLKGQWLIAHQLYETAVQHKYHLININHIQGIQHPLEYYTSLCSVDFAGYFKYEPDSSVRNSGIVSM